MKPSHEAIVLSGGFGTRLQSVISDVPKPMAPVAGKPFLEHLFHYLHREKIDHVILAVGYLHETIMQHFGNSFLNIRITYSIEKEALGTGGAMLQACQYLENEEAFVINGDTFFDIPLDELQQFHNEKKGLLSIALKKMFAFERYGTVEINDTGMVTGFNEKKYVEEGLINAGVYFLNSKIFSEHLPAVFSFEKEILEKEFKNGSVFGKEFDAYFIDIGIPGDYQQAQNDFTG